MKLSYKIILIVYCGFFVTILFTILLILPLMNNLFSLLPFLSTLPNIVKTILQMFVLLFLSIIPSTLLVWWLLVKLTIKPLEHLNQITQIIAQGNLGQKTDITTKDEVGELSGNINTIVKNLGGAFQSMADSLRDLKRKEKELAQNLDQLKEAKGNTEALLTSIGDGVIAIDNQGLIIFINRSAELILDWKTNDLNGKPWHPALLAIDQKNNKYEYFRTQPLLYALQTKEKLSISCFLMRKNNTIFPTTISISPVVVKETVKGIIIVFRDITQEKQVDKMKTEFISLASHQLRTPLSAIRWFTELLLEGAGGNLNIEQKELAQNISQSTQRMIELINSLLNISRIESGRIIIDPRPTDLVDLVKGIITELQVKIHEREQHLVVSVHEHLPLINVDPRLIRQVYLNLLTNAIKYTPKGGQVIVFISKKGDQIISQVSDTGFGIPKHQFPKIFQKFFRAENVVKIETDGSGLGLYLVKAIIESSHGKIWFDSEEGKGTTFWFSLPLSGMSAKQGEVTLDS